MVSRGHHKNEKFANFSQLIIVRIIEVVLFIWRFVVKAVEHEWPGPKIRIFELLPGCQTEAWVKDGMQPTTKCWISVFDFEPSFPGTRLFLRTRSPVLFTRRSVSSSMYAVQTRFRVLSGG